MDKIGIICEYNPFHNGHIYHINKIKEKFPDSFITLVLSSSFTERGEFSFLTKWEKTKIALNIPSIPISNKKVRYYNLTNNIEIATTVKNDDKKSLS